MAPGGATDILARALGTKLSENLPLSPSWHLTVPETREQLSKQGADPRTGTPEEFAAAMENDMKKWQRVVAAAGIKPQ